jgi:hypothetical protein
MFEGSQGRILRDYDRQMLRSAFVTTFWSAIMDRKKKPEGFKLQNLADRLQIGKSGVSRWFSGNAPNWRIDTIADIADALDLDVQVVMRNRIDGKIYNSHVSVSPVRTISAPTMMNIYRSVPRAGAVPAFTINRSPIGDRSNNIKYVEEMAA